VTVMVSENCRAACGRGNTLREQRQKTMSKGGLSARLLALTHEEGRGGAYVTEGNRENFDGGINSYEREKKEKCAERRDDQGTGGGGVRVFKPAQKKKQTVR